jgi:hypothetical protein
MSEARINQKASSLSPELLDVRVGGARPSQKQRPLGGAQGAARSVRIKTVALPVEHGGWGLSLEPIVLGLAVAPSLQGALLAIATVGVFLARHPLKIVAADRRNTRRVPRTVIAERFVLLYGAIALLCFMGAILAGPPQFLFPLTSAAPLAVVQLVYDAKGQSRKLWPELAGSTAMAAVASSLALAGGWRMTAALALWAVLAARVVPTILYVRARLMALYGKLAPSKAPVAAVHVLALALICFLALSKLASLITVCAFVVLLFRALFGLYAKADKQVTPKKIGIRELGFGAMTVLAVIIGHFAGV